MWKCSNFRTVSDVQDGFSRQQRGLESTTIVPLSGRQRLKMPGLVRRLRSALSTTTPVSNTLWYRTSGISTYNAEQSERNFYKNECIQW